MKIVDDDDRQELADGANGDEPGKRAGPDARPRPEIGSGVSKRLADFIQRISVSLYLSSQDLPSHHRACPPGVALTGERLKPQHSSLAWRHCFPELQVAWIHCSEPQPGRHVRKRGDGKVQIR